MNLLKIRDKINSEKSLECVTVRGVASRIVIRRLGAETCRL